jgi:hypothetical protein
MKLEYKKFSITLEKYIGYQVSQNSFDDELVTELTKMGNDEWEVVILRFDRIAYFKTENVCRCYYKGIFKRYINTNLIITDDEKSTI